MCWVFKILSIGVFASAMSAVRYPCFSVCSTALITASDSSFIPKEISSSRAADKMDANGFAMPFPVMSCALPWMGSYNQTLSPMDAEANIPIEPAI